MRCWWEGNSGEGNEVIAGQKEGVSGSGMQGKSLRASGTWVDNYSEQV